MTETLITRLETLEGPCRECDVLIKSLASAQPLSFTPKYTSSLDAIVGLIERDLPGWWRHVHVNPDGASSVSLNLLPFTKGYGEGGHATEAIATCIAYTKAKAAQEQT